MKVMLPSGKEVQVDSIALVYTESQIANLVVEYLNEPELKVNVKVCDYDSTVEITLDKSTPEEVCQRLYEKGVIDDSGIEFVSFFVECFGLPNSDDFEYRLTEDKLEVYLSPNLIM